MHFAITTQMNTMKIVAENLKISILCTPCVGSLPH